MRRRDLLLGTIAGFGVQWIPDAFAQDSQLGRDMAYREQAMQDFPFELVETDGRSALETWEKLKREKRGAPIVVGGAEEVAVLYYPFDGPEDRDSKASIDVAIAKSMGLKFPDDLQEMRRKDHEAGCARLAEMKRSGVIQIPEVAILGPSGERQELSEEESLHYFMAGCEEEYHAVTGEWPSEPPRSPGLTVAADWKTGEPLETVYIALIPTDDLTAIPVHLRYGGWNENPNAEFHMAALRSWHERYGAEIVGITHDTMNLRVHNRPSSREEAIELVREQYDYCADLVNQGVGDLSSLAAMLMESDWWYFWWD